MRRRRLKVVAAVIERAGEFLVSLRHPKGVRPSKWEFPGGKVERGESPEAALIREVREELGVQARIGRLVHQLVFPYSDLDVELYFYAVEIVDGDPRPLSMAELRWVARTDLPSLDFLEADRDFVGALSRGEM